jgi:DNA-binding MarR family transcriptional regulator
MERLEHEALVARILGTIDRILQLEKGRAFDVEGERIYPSEAHLLLLVDRERDLNATGIAHRVGLTKGAVSQTLSRLERKGLLTKTRDTTRKNELILRFTGRGRRAVARFRKLEAALAARLDRRLATLSAQERTVIAKFAEDLVEILGVGR